MGSEIGYANGFDYKKYRKLPKEVLDKINARRKEIGIRSIELDERLTHVILEIENLKPRQYLARRVKGNNLLFKCLFTSRVP